MLTPAQQLSLFIAVCALLCSAAAVQGQTSLSELQKALHDKANFEETDFAALQRGETIVKLAPVQDKGEVAVSGVVSLHATADQFLRSFSESLTHKTSPAVLQAGSFGTQPSLDDLKNLTLEAQDIEDLKDCVAGDCEIKLSAAMMQRFTREINWQAPDYAQQVTQLFKTMLLDYVRDYRVHGDAALIEYNDKQDEVRVADEQRTLNNASGYLNDLVPTSGPAPLHPLEDLIVWSKIKFGLKPVISINHVTIYKGDGELGPQVLAVSKQLYANHYFNSSLALTGFVTVAGPESYLIYENRSRADSLEGPLSKFKRSIVQNKALEGLKGILEQSKLTLDAPVLGRESASSLSEDPSGGWSRRLFGGIRPVLWIVIISALIALLALRTYEGKANRTAGMKQQLKPEQR
jgi:hypothetical protein